MTLEPRNTEHGAGLVELLLSLPIFQSEWVLWLLILLSGISIAIMMERVWFYGRRRVAMEQVLTGLRAGLAKHEYRQLQQDLNEQDSLETNVLGAVIAYGGEGPEAVEEHIAQALLLEKVPYDRRLGVLATIASSAPFIGLFGTVLGIVRAFKDLATAGDNATAAVMLGVSEALVATAVGLAVAIPAVVAYNLFKAHVGSSRGRAVALTHVLLAHLKSVS